MSGSARVRYFFRVKPDNICKVAILVTPQWLWTEEQWYIGLEEKREMETNQRSVILWMTSSQSEPSVASTRPIRGKEEWDKTSCVCANKWSVVNSVLAQDHPLMMSQSNSSLVSVTTWHQPRQCATVFLPLVDHTGYEIIEYIVQWRSPVHISDLYPSVSPCVCLV